LRAVLHPLRATRRSPTWAPTSAVDQVQTQVTADYRLPILPGETFALREVADFEWDRVVVIGPYASNEYARRALGFE